MLSAISAAKMTTRSASPEPQAHQKALGDTERAARSPRKLTAEASHAAVRPAPAARNRTESPEKCLSATNPPAARRIVSPAPRRAILALRALDESIKSNRYPRESPDQHQPRPRPEMTVEPLARQKSDQYADDNFAPGRQSDSKQAFVLVLVVRREAIITNRFRSFRRPKVLRHPRTKGLPGPRPRHAEFTWR